MVWSIVPALMLITGCQKELPVYTDPVVVVDDRDTTGNHNIDTTDEDDNVYYYIRFQVNGVDVEYNAYTKATFPVYVRQGTNLYSCQVEGQLQLNGTINTINLTINDSVPIVINKLFTDKLLFNATQGVIGYNDAGNNIFSSVAAAPDADVKLVLTEITTAFVTGTFSGKTRNVLENTGGIFPESADITNGLFKVRRF